MRIRVTALKWLHFLRAGKLLSWPKGKRDRVRKRLTEHLMETDDNPFQLCGKNIIACMIQTMAKGANEPVYRTWHSCMIWLILPPPTAAPVMLSEPVDNNADGDTDDRDNNHIVN